MPTYFQMANKVLTGRFLNVFPFKSKYLMICFLQIILVSYNILTSL